MNLQNLIPLIEREITHLKEQRDILENQPEYEDTQATYMTGMITAYYMILDQTRKELEH